MENMPAGWLPDPRDEWVERYWDGQKWTGQTRVAASAKPEARRAQPASGPTAPRAASKKTGALRGFISIFVGTAVVLLGVSLGLAYLEGRGDEPSETSAAAGPGPACVSAFEDAAAVPLDQTNDTEMVRTVSDCATVDEWSAGIARYPEALGMTRAPTQAELPMTLSNVCFGNESTAMCQDAAAQGYLD
jgi:hypothetical protein